MPAVTTMSGSTASHGLLREDLRLHEASSDPDGSPAWVIEDPVVNRFYRIGWLEFECLLRWGDPAPEIAAAISRDTPLDPDASQVEDFQRFLAQHSLLRPDGEKLAQLLSQARQPGSWKRWQWWLHHYLFFRIPLLRPQYALQRLAGVLAPLFRPWAVWATLASIVTGLLLVARQWEVFVSTLVESVSPAGLLGFLLALSCAKALHELAHALVATHYGVRVAHMGIAFLVLWPMLYTDTGESWKLKKRRQRLAVAAAGMTTELALAGLATLVWSIADPGPTRSAAFYLATTGWTLSLALNASPFMRFDGYFILSDLLDLPNLHERSGALARAALRRTLFGWNEPDREYFPPWPRRALIGFAFATWIYRLGVFLAIAAVVYYFFFKVLGIFLFLVEITWFIARPIWSELRVWCKRWQETPAQRRRTWLFALFLLVILALIPWRSDIHGPGLVHPLLQQRVFAPFPAQIGVVRSPGAVLAGEELVLLYSQDLHDQERQTQAGITALGERLSGIEAVEGALDQRNATRERLGEQLARGQSVDDELIRLSIRAEFNGRWLDVDPLAGSGSWLGTLKPIGVLIDPAVWVVDAYVGQADIERIEVGAAARFFPEHQNVALAGRIVEVDLVRSQRLPHAMLTIRHGGPIATVAGGNELQPIDSRYRVRVRLDEPPQNWRELRGSVSLTGKSESLAYAFVVKALAVLIRESGF